MSSRSFGKSKQDTSALSPMNELNERLEMLEKKENHILKKATVELERAKAFTRTKNKRAAIQCLKRKRLFEQQAEQLGNFQLRIHDQMITLEGAKSTADTVEALRIGAAAMKDMHKATKVDDIDKTISDINEQNENMKQIQESLSAPLGASSDFDEDELEAELEELEGAELRQPTTVQITPLTPPVHVPEGRRTVQITPQETAEEDDLAKLQAEMAL